MTLRARFFQAWSELPVAYDDLFAQGPAQDLGLSRAWFELLATTILVRGERLCLAAVEAAEGTPCALLVGAERSTPWSGRRFRSLANFYTMSWAPLLAPEIRPEPALGCLADAFAAARPRFAEVHLEPLAAETGIVSALAAAFEGAGFRSRRYHRFGNRFEPVAGLSAAAYLATRPGRLRSTLGRKRAALHRAGRLDLRVVRDTADLAAGVAAYQALHRASWKPAEPFPGFVPGLIHLLAQAGQLRLGVLTVDQRPIAAQIWVVRAGAALLYKLAHDRAFDRLSPGTVLMADMVGHLLDVEHVHEIDLGAGDQLWKVLWAGERRERVGLLAVGRHSPAALLMDVKALLVRMRRDRSAAERAAS